MSGIVMSKTLANKTNQNVRDRNDASLSLQQPANELLQLSLNCIYCFFLDTTQKFNESTRITELLLE
ncbi:hypothetical protein RRG08_047838 [Elysia crispata]|uniref:Uncharacterized protein n=1 Tax=Elysia crispata TaxID=231223 RepID=A0AAE0ZWY6_9GAST|nr:hypothetical protein RRG08_047838 [Elysia crispata]